MEDQIIWQSLFEILIVTVYKGPLILLFLLWQMQTWHRVSYATVILSDIISLFGMEAQPQKGWCFEGKTTPLFTLNMLYCGQFCLIADKKFQPYFKQQNELNASNYEVVTWKMFATTIFPDNKRQHLRQYLKCILLKSIVSRFVCFFYQTWCILPHCLSSINVNLKKYIYALSNIRVFLLPQ